MRQPDNPFWPRKSILHPPSPKEPVIPVRRIRKALTREEQRAVDQAATRIFQIPLNILMEHAGLAVTEICEYMAGAKTTPVYIFAGKGNNGGDAYVCARLLHSRGYPVTVWDCFPGFSHTGIVKTVRESAELLGVRIRPAEEFDPQNLRSGVARMVNDQVSGIPCVIIDGIIGSGYERIRLLPPSLQTVTNGIEEAHIRGARVIAIDIPTGVDANTSEVDPHAVCADCTVTFILPKQGMTHGRGRELCGQIRVFPLGLPINFADIALKG